MQPVQAKLGGVWEAAGIAMYEADEIRRHTAMEIDGTQVQGFISAQGFIWLRVYLPVRVYLSGPQRALLTEFRAIFSTPSSVMVQLVRGSFVGEIFIWVYRSTRHG